MVTMEAMAMSPNVITKTCETSCQRNRNDDCTVSYKNLLLERRLNTVNHFLQYESRATKNTLSNI